MGRLFLGNGRFKPGLRAVLESEGLVIMEEGLPGSVRYRHFKAPGRRFHGKVTPERVAFAITQQRVAAYCRSGRVKLVDSAFSDPRLRAVDASLHEVDTVSLQIDYDRAGVPNVSGEIEIRFRTEEAATTVDHLRARLGR